jgi:hypothetical protein
MKGGFTMILKEIVIALVGYYPGTYVDGLRKIHKHVA